MDIFHVFLSYEYYIIYLCSQNHIVMANTELRIKELCKERGITQAQLAEKLSIQAVSFSQAIARNKFSIDRLADIADALSVEIPDLFKANSSSFTCPKCGAKLKLVAVDE